MAAAQIDDTIPVLGTPRHNLNPIDFLVKKHGTTQPAAPLHYETIVVSVYSQ